MSNIKTMTEGKPLKLIIAFALPLMLGNVFQQLYTVVDTIVVGNFLSVAGLAAIGAGDWLYWGIFASVQGFAQGFSIKMAQNFGAGKYDKLKGNIADSIILSIIISTIVFIIGQLIVVPVLNILQTPADIIGMTMLYLRTVFFGIPVTMAYNLAASILRSLGDSKTPLNAMIVASITNIILDLTFVVVFKLGIAGAAIATVLAQLVSGLYCLYFIKKIDIIKLTKDDYKSGLMNYFILFKLGYPMAFQNLIIAIGGMIVQSVVNKSGVTFIAGFTATNKLYGLLEIAAVSFGYAMVTYIGQNLGARKIDRIKSGVKAATILSIGISMIISMIMIIFGKNILSLFLSGTPSEVEAAMSVAYKFLCIMSYGLSILYILHVIRSSLQGMGNTFLPMVSGVVEFIMRTSSVLLLPLFIGEMGIFLAESLAWLGADVVLITSYFFIIRKLDKNVDVI